MSDIPRELDALFRSENAQLYGVSVWTFRFAAFATSKGVCVGTFAV